MNVLLPGWPETDLGHAQQNGCRYEGRWVAGVVVGGALRMGRCSCCSSTSLSLTATAGGDEPEVDELLILLFTAASSLARFHQLLSEPS